MAKGNLLVVYYSKQGHTKRMAEAIGRGAERAGARVSVKAAEDCALADLTDADAIAVGSPTYFSNVAWQVKKLIDESIRLYGGRRLQGKVGLAFTSSGTERDAKDCLKMIDLAFRFHHGMTMVPGVLATDAEAADAVAERCEKAGAELAKRCAGEQ